MSNRFSRDTSRNSLFSTYDNRSASPSKTKSKPKSPLPSSGYGYGNGNGYGYGYAEPRPSSQPPAGDHHHHHLTTPAFSAYPGSSSSANGSATGSGGFGLGQGQGQGQGHADFRPATPNSRGQYSAAVLDELESQNDEHVGILSGKVKDLKNLTHLIGNEIRDSSALADKMNDQFENSRLKLRGTMNRMLRMAEKTGVGWRVWLGFFAFVILLFWYVWLF